MFVFDGLGHFGMWCTVVSMSPGPGTQAGGVPDLTELDLAVGGLREVPTFRSSTVPNLRTPKELVRYVATAV